MRRIRNLWRAFWESEYGQALQEAWKNYRWFRFLILWPLIGFAIWLTVNEVVVKLPHPDSIWGVIWIWELWSTQPLWKVAPHTVIGIILILGVLVAAWKLLVNSKNCQGKTC